MKKSFSYLKIGMATGRIMFFFMLTGMLSSVFASDALLDVKMNSGDHSFKALSYSDDACSGSPNIIKGDKDVPAVTVNLDAADPGLILRLNHWGKIEVTDDIFLNIEYRFTDAAGKNILDICLQTDRPSEKVTEKESRGTPRGYFRISPGTMDDNWYSASLALTNLNAKQQDILQRILFRPASDTKKGSFQIRKIELVRGSVKSNPVESCKATEAEYEKPAGKKILAIYPKSLWHTDEETYYSEKAVREVYENGYNVLGVPSNSPSLPPEQWKGLSTYKKLAEKIAPFPGLKLYPQIGMCRTVPEDFPYSKYIDYTGKEFLTPCPADEKYWDERVIPFFAEYAKLSLEIPTFALQMDWEFYCPYNKADQNTYRACYCDKCWKHFFEASGMDTAGIPAAKRPDWLREKQLDGKYQDMYRKEIYGLARKLRNTIDGINPELPLWIVPSFFGIFANPMLTGLSTQKAPIVFSDENTYGKPTSVLSDDEAIEANLKRCINNQKALAKLNIPFVYIAAVGNNESGSAVYRGRAAIQMAKISNGLWCFEDLTPYKKTDLKRDELWKIFAEVNKEVTNGTYRENPEWKKENGKKQITVPEGKKGVGLFKVPDNLLPKNDSLFLYAVENIDDLSGTKLLILENFNANLENNSHVCRKLREFVMNGGSLLLSHDTAHFMASPFPEIVESYVVPEESLDGRHILDKEINIVDGCKYFPAFSGKTFESSFSDHLVFKTGKSGEIIAKDKYAYPVIVAGTAGKGKVIFSGCIHKLAKDGTIESDFTREMLQWLLK